MVRVQVLTQLGKTSTSDVLLRGGGVFSSLLTTETAHFVFFAGLRLLSPPLTSAVRRFSTR